MKPTEIRTQTPDVRLSPAPRTLRLKQKIISLGPQYFPDFINLNSNPTLLTRLETKRALNIWHSRPHVNALYRKGVPCLFPFPACLSLSLIHLIN